MQRITDGSWTTLDARTIYQSVVEAIEHYNGLLFDELHRRLRTAAELRAPAVASHNFVLELAGIDPALISEFSARARSIELEEGSLVAKWMEDHSHEPSETTVLKLRQQATLATRPPKSGDRLHEWQVRGERLGMAPDKVDVIPTPE